MKYWSIVLGIAVVIIVGGAILTKQPQNSDSSNSLAENNPDTAAVQLPEKGEVPDISLTNYAGNDVSLASSTEKVKVINSWATWCPFCTDELPAFAKLQEAFPNRVEVIAINRQESRSKAKNFTDNREISNDMTFLLDPQDRFYQQIGGFSMPETIFVDTQGLIRIHKRGPMEFSEMKEKVQQVLEVSDMSR